MTKKVEPKLISSKEKCEMKKKELCAMCLKEFEADKNEDVYVSDWGNIFVCPKCITNHAEEGGRVVRCDPKNNRFVTVKPARKK